MLYTVVARDCRISASLAELLPRTPRQLPAGGVFAFHSITSHADCQHAS
jgi:hypothetical protein